MADFLTKALPVLKFNSIRDKMMKNVNVIIAVVKLKKQLLFLSHKLEALENPSTSLNQNLKIIEEIENNVSVAEGPVADMAKQKLKFVLDKNKGIIR